MEKEREILFSEPVKAGKRIYYFDVKETRNGERFLTITESKKIVEGDAANPQFTFQKHKIFLYKEDYEKFVSALLKTIDVAKGAPIPEPEVHEEPMPRIVNDGGEFSIDLEF